MSGDEGLIPGELIPDMLENAVDILETSGGHVPPRLQGMIKELAERCGVPLPQGKAPSQSSMDANGRRHSLAASVNLGDTPTASMLSGSRPGSAQNVLGPRMESESLFSDPSGTKSNTSGGGGDGASSDGAATTDGNKQVIPMRACVVCGQVRAGEQRKSGFKCYMHIGVPSSATFVSRVEELDFLDVKKFTMDQKPLGRGSFGKVHKATHIASGQKFAVKILDRSTLERLKMISKIEAEISILKQLSHPNIVKIYAVAESSGEDDFPKMNIMMEFLEGGQICHIDEEGRCVEELPLVRIKKWLLGMAVGLQYMHEKGFVHRDIKPENILVDRKKDCIKLTDFGVSSDLSGEDANHMIGAVEGSPAFMPPELFQSSSSPVSSGLDAMTTGKAQDVWAFGVTAFVLIFRFLPFYGKSRTELTAQVLNKPLPFPPNADPVAVDLISMMLQRDIFKRGSIPDVIRHPFFRGVRIVKGIPVEADPISLVCREYPGDVPADTRLELNGDDKAKEDATVFLPPNVYMGTQPLQSSPAGAAVASSAAAAAAATAVGGGSDGDARSPSSPNAQPWTKAQAALGQFVIEANAKKRDLELVVGSTYSVTLVMSERDDDQLL